MCISLYVHNTRTHTHARTHTHTHMNISLTFVWAGAHTFGHILFRHSPHALFLLSSRSSCPSPPSLLLPLSSPARGWKVALSTKPSSTLENHDSFIVSEVGPPLGLQRRKTRSSRSGAPYIQRRSVVGSTTQDTLEKLRRRSSCSGSECCMLSTQMQPRSSLHPTHPTLRCNTQRAL